MRTLYGVTEKGNIELFVCDLADHTLNAFGSIGNTLENYNKISVHSQSECRKIANWKAMHNIHSKHIFITKENAYACATELQRIYVEKHSLDNIEYDGVKK